MNECIPLCTLTPSLAVVALVQGSTEAPAVNGQRIEELARQQLRDASRVLRSGGGEDSGFSGRK